jgi:UDP-glucose 6-dehydrogenase
LADFGYSVVGVDKDIKKVENLNKSIPPLFEPGQETLIKADRVTNIRKTNIENTNVL